VQEKWNVVIDALARHPRGAPLTESTVADFERRAGFQLPADLARLYLALGNGFTPYFLPLITGREDEALVRSVSDPAKAFAEASTALGSVLAWHDAHRSVPTDAEDVWVSDLLLVADYGCAIYFALDLSVPELRVVEYQNLLPCENSEVEARAAGLTLAYTDDRVPAPLRLRFTVAAPSLYGWLTSWIAHGDWAARRSVPATGRPANE